MPRQKSWVKAECAKCLISFTNLLQEQFIPSDTFKTLYSALQDFHISYFRFQSEWELEMCASPESQHWGQAPPEVLCDWILDQHGWGCLLSIYIPKVAFHYYFRYKGKMTDWLTSWALLLGWSWRRNSWLRSCPQPCSGGGFLISQGRHQEGLQQDGHHHDTSVSVFITNNFEEVLILGSLEERGLSGHLTQVAALAVEFDTLQHNSGLCGLALLRMEICW